MILTAAGYYCDSTSMNCEYQTEGCTRARLRSVRCRRNSISDAFDAKTIFWQASNPACCNVCCEVGKLQRQYYEVNKSNFFDKNHKSAHKTLPQGICPKDSAPKTLHQGICPQTTRWLLAIARSASDKDHLDDDHLDDRQPQRRWPGTWPQKTSGMLT